VGRREPIFVAMAVAVLGLGGRALAASGSLQEGRPVVEPIRLTYSAPPECPDEADFVGRTHAMSARFRAATPAEAARVFEVRLDGGIPSTGRITIRGADQVIVGTRSVEGDTCADVAEAIALVIALAVDPRASRETEAGRVVEAELPLPSVPPALGRDFRDSRSQRAFAGADLAVVSGVGPTALFAASPFVGWRAHGSFPFDPSVRLAFLRAGTGSFQAPEHASASLTLTVGRLDACPATVRHAFIRGTACVRVEAGALEAAGANIADARSTVRPWLAAGPVARAEVVPIAPLFVDVEAGALFRIYNDRFALAPDIPLYEVPVVGFFMGAGAGVDFL
jgi:hypothetical protein